MAQPLTITDRIMDVMQRAPACRLDEMVQNCEDFSWQTVLFEVNRLSREGQLRLRLTISGIFTVRLVERESPVMAGQDASATAQERT